MKTGMYKSILVAVSLGLCITAQARENVNDGAGHRDNAPNVILTGCNPGKTQTEIKLNDVRTRILTDGDMWWDLSNAKYEVPKGSGSMAEFAGALWFGGFHNNALRIAAMTYRQSGVDFWPGPIDPSTDDVDGATCSQYDKHWDFLRKDVDDFYAYWQQYQAASPATPNWIKDYPGTYPYGTFNLTSGIQSVSIYYLAPFHDNNGDNIYNYADGDYPNYNVTGANVPRVDCVRRLFGDETLFWVFNDKGNKHTETGSVNSIGVEIRAQAFEFSTGDELNQASFYAYEVINWSSDVLDSTYFSVWNDTDLGNYQDDYIGCDVQRGLGIQYNGDNYDDDFGGIVGYHDKLPAIGCDFFQGPYADVGDGIDNDRDSCIDCTWKLNPDGSYCYSCPKIPDTQQPEQIIMSRFSYYNNTGDANVGNPTTAGNGIQYYNFMRGLWRSGIAMTYGNAGTTTGNKPCLFLFPGTTDKYGWGLGYAPGTATVSPPPAYQYGTTGWTEDAAGILPNDMRFIISCGKFTLKPGAVNYVTYGIPFARSNSANHLDPIPLLKTADDKAQALFDNCFKVLDGPDAPDLTIQELSNQLLVTISNSPYSNNYEAKRYADVDPNIQPVGSVAQPDKFFRFEGYMIFQLKDESVGPTDIYNTDKARIVFQCDIKNGVAQLINYNADNLLGLVPQAMIPGGAADNGIQNSLVISADKFSSTNPRMNNFQNYYYMAVAYAHNNYLTYVPNVPPTVSTTTTGTVTTIGYTDPSSGDYNGQKKPFLLGRRNIKIYTGIPHDPSPESNGTVMNSSYGIGPQITRVEGQGNGGLALDLTDQSISDILNSPVNRAQKLTYIGTRGPINVKVTDPLRVVKGDFTVKFIQAVKVKAGTDSLWQYYGNPPVASINTLDTGKVKGTPITVGGSPTAIRWYMTGNYTDAGGNHVSKTWLSDEGINLGQEKIVTGLNNESLGFSVTIRQVSDPQMTAKALILSPPVQQGITESGDLLESSMTFANTSTPWLGAVQDVDGSSTQDWILSGGASEDIGGLYGNPLVKPFFADPSGIWSKVVNGTWAPFRFVRGILHDYEWGPSYYTTHGGANPLRGMFYGDTRLLASVNVVFTSDKSKWSRCPVIDLNNAVNPQTTIPYKWQLRKAPSVDQNGTPYATGTSPDFDSSMSWFPGYAINVETGERLNIIFGENSADSLNRGRDMMWNPTKNISDSKGDVIHGGMHYVYICGHNSDGMDTIGGVSIESDIRRYDKGVSAYHMIKGLSTWGINTTSKWSLLSEVFKDIMWVNIPLSANGFDIANPSQIPCDVTVRIRVPKPYRYGLSTVCQPGNTSHNGPNINLEYIKTPLSYSAAAVWANSLPADVVSSPQNGNFPMYTFNTYDLAPKRYDQNTAVNALAKINIVPNPYYGHSAYEKTRLDNVVKIINLPIKCKLRIYTLAGTLIRTLEKDNDQTYLTWDLKNDKNIQIASGLYIIHIDAPGIGERIIKWFGVMRPYDLQSY